MMKLMDKVQYILYSVFTHTWMGDHVSNQATDFPFHHCFKKVAFLKKINSLELIQFCTLLCTNFHHSFFFFTEEMAIKLPDIYQTLWTHNTIKRNLYYSNTSLTCFFLAKLGSRLWETQELWPTLALGSLR